MTMSSVFFITHCFSKRERQDIASMR
jgi:hypothetical protein